MKRKCSVTNKGHCSRLPGHPLPPLPSTLPDSVWGRHPALPHPGVAQNEWQGVCPVPWHHGRVAQWCALSCATGTRLGAGTGMAHGGWLSPGQLRAAHMSLGAFRHPPALLWVPRTRAGSLWGQQCWGLGMWHGPAVPRLPSPDMAGCPHSPHPASTHCGKS